MPIIAGNESGPVLTNTSIFCPIRATRPGEQPLDFRAIDHNMLNHLEVGVSIVTFRPDDPDAAEWVLINDARCRMSGFTREELMQTRPFGQMSRKLRAQIMSVNQEILDKGQIRFESTMLHKSESIIPVIAHMKLIEIGGEKAVLVEFHDIRTYKETEARLKLAQESTAEMLTMIEKGKQDLTRNFTRNLGLVLLPLVDQLRMSASDHQKEILDLMIRRIEDVGRDMGIVDKLDSFGANLTRRQIMVCEMIRDGMTSKEIAQVLGCSPSTVNNHRNLIRKKLKLSGKSANLQAYLNSTARS